MHRQPSDVNVGEKYNSVALAGLILPQHASVVGVEWQFVVVLDFVISYVNFLQTPLQSKSAQNFGLNNTEWY